MRLPVNRVTFIEAPCKVSTTVPILHSAFYSFLSIYMIVTNEIASITILVPHQKGNETVNQIVPFKVFRKERHYTAVPLISNEERMVTGLSAELYFKFIEHRIIPEPETKGANLTAINNIAGELRMLRIV